jgi:hypothetical protein
VAEDPVTQAEVSDKVLGGLEVAVDVIERAAKNYVGNTGAPNMKALQHMAAAAVLLGRAADALQNESGGLRLVR